MCLCYLFNAKTAWQLVNRKADFLQNELIRITNRIANWNALLVVLLASDRLAVVLSSYWYRLVICYFKWHYFKSEGRGPDLRKWRGPRMVALRVWSLVCLNTTVQNVRFSLTTTTRRRLKRAQTNATHTYSTQRAYTYIGLHVDAWRNRFILVMHEPQGLKNSEISKHVHV